MPQLEKGGKYVFGLSIIGRDGSIVIPPEAMQEYQYQEGDGVVLMNGSRTSGGFVVTEKRLIEKSLISAVFSTAPGLMDGTLPEAAIVKNRGRSFCWTSILPGGYINLPENTLVSYGAEPGGILMVARGSNFGISFIARGPLWKLALSRTDVIRYSRN